MNATGTVLRASTRDLSRNGWILSYAFAFLLIPEALFWFGGTGPQVLLSLLNIVLLVVPLVCLIFGVLHVHASRRFVELLLTQPVSRRSLFAGLYLGLALPLSAAFVAGSTIPFLLNLRSGASVQMLLVFEATGTVLTLTFSALAIWIALRWDDRLRSVGLALGSWLLLTFVYDGVILALAALLAEYPLEKPLLALTLANPIDLARVTVLTSLDSAVFSSFGAALLRRTMSGAAGTVLVISAFAAWWLIPLRMGARRFRLRDF